MVSPFNTMSYIRKANDDQQSFSDDGKTSNLYLQLNVVPIPQSLDKYDASIKEKQSSAIAMIEARGRDLFDKNETRVSLNGHKKLYQSEMLYGKVLSIENLIPMLTSQGLTLKVQAVRTGVDSHSTCMELKTGVLADLIEQSADEKGDKVTELQLVDETVGKMFVAIKEFKGSHYIQKVDYEVLKEIDDKLHI